MKYYITAYKTGIYPAVTKDRVFTWARLYPAAASAPDPVGKPANWQWVSLFSFFMIFFPSPPFSLSFLLSFCISIYHHVSPCHNRSTFKFPNNLLTILLSMPSSLLLFWAMISITDSRLPLDGLDPDRPCQRHSNVRQQHLDDIRSRWPIQVEVASADELQRPGDRH